MTQPATVFVVDDNPSVRNSIFELMTSVSLPVETFASSAEFLAAFHPQRAGCLVLDVRLKEGSGLDLQDELVRMHATLPIIVLTGHGNVQTSVRAMKAGAFDFMQKPPSPVVLIEKVQAALGCDRAARALVAGRKDALELLASLTPRERDVMSLLVAGESSKEVAGALELSVRTVEGHRRRVLSKLHVTSAAQLVRVVMIACAE